MISKRLLLLALVAFAVLFYRNRRLQLEEIQPFGFDFEPVERFTLDSKNSWVLAAVAIVGAGICIGL